MRLVATLSWFFVVAGCGTPVDVHLAGPATSGLGTGAASDAILGQLHQRGAASRRTDAGSIGYVAGVALGSGHLFIADFANKRVLAYESVSSLVGSANFGAHADLVLLQPNAWVSDFRNIPTTPINHRIDPTGVEVDSNGRLYAWDDSNVLVFYDPYTDDTVADTELRGEPLTIRSVRALGANRLAVVGATAIHFYELDRPDPYAQARIASPCGADMVDIAEVGGAYFVACMGNVLDSTGALLVSGIFVYAIDSTTGLPSLGPGNTPPVGYRAYTDMSGIASLVAAEDRLLVADRAGNRVLRFDSPSAHANAVISDSGVTPPQLPIDASTIYGQPDAVSTMPNYHPSLMPTVTADGLHGPGRIVVDATDRRMWLADEDNFRVLAFADVDVGAADRTAKVVLGQKDMSHDRANRLEETSYDSIRGVAVGTRGSMVRAVVVDETGHRALVYDNFDSYTTGDDPSYVLGQASGLDSEPNRGQTTILGNGLAWPLYAAIDPGGDVWVGDTGNGRILHYSSLGTGNATQTFGAVDATSQGVFAALGGLDVTSGQVFVAAGSRVLMFDRANPGTAVSRVFGQDQPQAVTPAMPCTSNVDCVVGQVCLAGSCHVLANTCNRGFVPGADTLCNVRDVAVDGDGTLWVADTGNVRVLWFENPTSNDLTAAVTADGVVGQPDLTTALAYGGMGVSPYGFVVPADIAVDDDGTLWVLDKADNRVLVFEDPKVPDPEVGLPEAHTALGQASRWESGSNNDPNGINSRTLSSPFSLDVDPSGHVLLISDAGNHRGLRFINNKPPVIEGTGSFEVERGATLTVQLTVTDPDGDSVDLQPVMPLPPGAQVAGVAVSYTAPDNAPVGAVARVNVVAVDNGPRSQSTTATVLFKVVDRIPESGLPPSPRPPLAPAEGCRAQPGGLAAFLVLLLWRRRRRL